MLNLRRSKQEYVETRSEELDQETLDYLNTLPKITGVAIISHEGEVISLPAPNRHHNVIRHMVDKLKHPIPIMGLQGFVCEDGTFLDRVCAKVVAINQGQLLERHQDGEELFSECVW